MPRCICGDLWREHERNPADSGYLACKVEGCACVAYEWDGEPEESEEPETPKGPQR